MVATTEQQTPAFDLQSPLQESTMDSYVELPCPYRAGNDISVRNHDKIWCFRIERTFDPFNFGCVMLVSPYRSDNQSKGFPSTLQRHHESPDRMILKIMDTRWMQACRDDKYLPPWTQSRQDEYISAICDGRAPYFHEWPQPNIEAYSELMERRKWLQDKNHCVEQKIRKKSQRLAKQERQLQTTMKDDGENGDVGKCKSSDSESDDTTDSGFTGSIGRMVDINYDSEGELPQPTLAEEEAFFLFQSKEHFEKELRAYEKLGDLQGDLVPKVFATVQTEPLAHAAPDVQAAHLQYPGLLMEFIEGTPLNKFLNRRAIEVPCEQVVQNMLSRFHILPYYNVVHNDLYTRNIIVRNDDPSLPENYVIIDLGMADITDDIETNYDEVCAKEGQKESDIEAANALFADETTSVTSDLEGSDANDESSDSGYEESEEVKRRDEWLNKQFRPISGWNRDELVLCEEIAKKYKKIGVDVNPELAASIWSSKRFPVPYLDSSWDARLTLSEIAFRMIMDDFWRVRDSTPLPKAILRRLQLSGKIDQIFWDDYGGFNMKEFPPHDDFLESDYDHPKTLGFIRRAIERIAECLTDDDVYCDPIASWHAFCIASDRAKNFTPVKSNIADITIFKQIQRDISLHILSADGLREPDVICSDSSEESRGSRESSPGGVSSANTSPLGSPKSLEFPKVRDRQPYAKSDRIPLNSSAVCPSIEEKRTPSDSTAVCSSTEEKRIPSNSTTVTSSTCQSSNSESWINEKGGGNGATPCEYLRLPSMTVQS